MGQQKSDVWSADSKRKKFLRVYRAYETKKAQSAKETGMALFFGRKKIDVLVDKNPSESGHNGSSNPTSFQPQKRPDGLNPNFVEHRAFDRYNFKDKRLCSLHIQNNAFEISSLSYGGLGINGDQELLPTQIRGAVLDILGALCYLDMDRVHIQAGFTGYQFRHERADSLLFLRRYLESLRIGNTLTRIPKELLKDELNTQDTIVMRGEGPCDLIYSLDEQKSNLKALLITFLFEGNYVSCQYQSGILTTAQRIDKSGTGSRMQPDGTANLEIIRQVCLILLGIRSNEMRIMIQQFVEKALAVLRAGVELAS